MNVLSISLFLSQQKQLKGTLPIEVYDDCCDDVAEVDADADADDDGDNEDHGDNDDGLRPQRNG